MTNRSLISEGLIAGVEQELVRKRAERECREIAQRYRTARRELLEDISNRGVVVNASLESAARYARIPLRHLDHEMHNPKQKLWHDLNLWLSTNCQGSTAVLHANQQWQIEAGDRESHRDGSADSCCEKSMGTNTGTYIDVSELYEMRHSGDPVQVAMGSEGISVWFELPADAAKFKLTWA
jgi:hypothetical protein